MFSFLLFFTLYVCVCVCVSLETEHKFTHLHMQLHPYLLITSKQLAIAVSVLSNNSINMYGATNRWALKYKKANDTLRH